VVSVSVADVSGKKGISFDDFMKTREKLQHARETGFLCKKKRKLQKHEVDVNVCFSLYIAVCRVSQ